MFSLSANMLQKQNPFEKSEDPLLCSQALTAESCPESDESGRR
jgi:hypothetical protein